MRRLLRTHPGREKLLMFLREVLLAVIGLTAGGMVAAGIFAFIVMIGIITRLASRTCTAAYTSIYENAIVLGGTLGNIWNVYAVNVPLGYVLLVMFGLFSGIFVGCLAMALAEVLKVFPILVRRVGLVEGLPALVASVAAGKFAGSLIQFMFHWR